MRGKQKNTETR